MKQSTDIQAKEAKIEESRDRIQALDESINDLQEVLLFTSEELEKLEGKRSAKRTEKMRPQTKDSLKKRSFV